jgi:hypothetical protein
MRSVTLMTELPLIDSDIECSLLLDRILGGSDLPPSRSP